MQVKSNGCIRLKKVKQYTMKLFKNRYKYSQIDREIREKNIIMLNFVFLGNPGSVSLLYAKYLV